MADGRLVLGGGTLVVMVLVCLLSLPWSAIRFDDQDSTQALRGPTWSAPMGRDVLGRPLHWRMLLGGAISLGIGVSAALVAVSIGVTWGATAGYAGGVVDAVMMRTVDVIYGLPAILLVVLINLTLKPVMVTLLGAVARPDTAAALGDVAALLAAIGGVSWLTLARVVRGQVLSLRALPFVESARACGVSPPGIFLRHLLPNLIGPIIVYTTLTVPAAILQESFLSFLGIGVQPPMPSWGNLAAEGVGELPALVVRVGVFRWWLVLWPCLLLAVTLMALNFVGDALRDRLDPRQRQLRPA